MSIFRPISVSPSLAKLFEKCIFLQIEEFLATTFYSSHQHGFRSCLSTDTALLDTVQFIHSGFNSGCVVVGVFLELAKAFDSIDHEILLNVLGNVGFDDAALAWFASYLSGRSPFVSASMFPISHGVIEGSVLGPALFLTRDV